MTLENGQRHGHVIDRSPTGLSAEARATSQARLAGLKIHPRDTLPNRTLLARLERAWMQTLGAEREQIGQWLDEFQSVLGTQQEQPITAARQRLEQQLQALRF